MPIQQKKGIKQPTFPHPPFKLAPPSRKQIPFPRQKERTLAGAMIQKFQTAAEPLARQRPSNVRPIHRPKRVLNNRQMVNALMARTFLKMAHFSSHASPKGQPAVRSFATHHDFSGPQTLATGLPASTSNPQSDTPVPSISRHHLALRANLPSTPTRSGSKVALLSTIPPVYPPIAREAGWEGTVIVRVVIQPDGQTGDVQVRKSSGYPILDQSAIEAIQTWRFTPARDGHIPIRSLVDIPINFDLQKLG